MSKRKKLPKGVRDTAAQALYDSFDGANVWAVPWKVRDGWRLDRRNPYADVDRIVTALADEGYVLVPAATPGDES